MIRSGMVAFHGDLESLMVQIDTVQPHEENYNNGDVALVVDSIMASGMYRPIYTQKSTGRIIAGNHTWMACKELGAEQIPVVALDVDDNTALRIMVADNEIAKKARPDLGQLYSILSHLNTEDSLTGTGITEAELENLRLLNEMPLEEDGHKSWPTLTFQVPPATRRAFYRMTEMAGGDRERFELVMRLAGWDGKA